MGMQKIALILAAFIISLMAKAQDSSLEKRLIKVNNVLVGPNSIGPCHNIKRFDEKIIIELDSYLEKANPILRFEEN